MPIYESADESVRDLIDEVMRAYHPELVKAGVEIVAKMAMAKRDADGRPKLPALKVRGVPANGAIRITTPLERAMEIGDAIMLLDGEQWPDWSDAQRRALIDHELQHLIAANTGDDEKDTDDYGRPKLSIRPHDREFGWFDCVAKRHGEHSFEHSQLAAFRRSCIDPGGAQLWLPFADDAATISPEKSGELRITSDDVERAAPIIERMARRRAASKS